MGIEVANEGAPVTLGGPPPPPAFGWTPAPASGDLETTGTAAFRTGRDARGLAVEGRTVQSGGLLRRVLTAVGGWILVVVAVIVVAAGVAVTTSTQGLSQVPAGPNPSTFTSQPHDNPDLEALLPSTVMGQTLPHESFRGRTLFRDVFGIAEPDVVQFEVELAAQGLTLDDVSIAVDGRANLADRPNFVTALRFTGIPVAELEARLGLKPGAMLVDDLHAGTFERVTVGGKEVLRGPATMIEQSEHAQGIPYLYAKDDIQFIVITDDPAWAADALRQLP